MEVSNRCNSVKHQVSILSISSDSSSFLSANSSVEMFSKSAIIIPDSNSEEENEVNEKHLEAINKIALPISQQTKVDNWLKHVNTYKDISSNVSLFSEVSEIKADASLSKPDRNQKMVANSTFQNDKCRYRFDELFKNNLEVPAENTNFKILLIENHHEVDAKTKKVGTTKTKSKAEFKPLVSDNGM